MSSLGTLDIASLDIASLKMVDHNQPVSLVRLLSNDSRLF